MPKNEGRPPWQGISCFPGVVNSKHTDPLGCMGKYGGKGAVHGTGEVKCPGMHGTALSSQGLSPHQMPAVPVEKHCLRTRQGDMHEIAICAEPT